MHAIHYSFLGHLSEPGWPGLAQGCQALGSVNTWGDLEQPHQQGGGGN